MSYGSNLNPNQRAFTLAETLLGISMLAVTFLALSALFVSTLRANKANLNSLLAYNLAQEGLELMRNGRDSNWLQNYGWGGTIGFSAPLDFTSISAIGDHSYYVISTDFAVNSGLQSRELGRFSDEADLLNQREIWLCEINDPTSPVGKYLVNNSTASATCEDFLSGAVKSRFNRYLKLEAIAQDAQANISKVLVTAKVLWFEPWDEPNSPSEITLTSELSDWKGGPL